MPSKNFLVNKKARDKWYKNNKQKQLKKQKERRKLLINWLFNYKKTLNCFDCNYSFKENPECLDFHHLRNKKAHVGQLVRNSLKSVKNEIKKCIPLCANCHRIKHKHK